MNRERAEEIAHKAMNVLLRDMISRGQPRQARHNTSNEPRR